MPTAAQPAATSSDSRAREIISFLILSVVLAPVLSVGLVGGMGFAIWIYQMIYGPPGAPPS